MPDRSAASGLVATMDLLRLAREGDSVARDQLFARYHVRLTRWASGRLPMRARSLLDTSDLVQETLMRVFDGLDRVEVRGPGGFQAYVRQAILNRIRDQIRWSARRPGPDHVPEALPDIAPSPLEHAIGADVLERYERALARLSAPEAEVVHMRVELALDYAEIAQLTGRGSADGARMAVKRALSRLADEMGHDR